MDKDFVNIKEAARIMGISRPTVYRMLADGRLTWYRKPAVKRGPVEIPRAEVEALRPR